MDILDTRNGELKLSLSVYIGLLIKNYSLFEPSYL